VTQRTNPPPLVARAMCLRSIFNDLEPMPTRQIENRVHVGRLTVKMDWYDCSRPRGNLGLDLADVDVVCSRIDVTKNDLCSSHGDDLGRRHKSVRCRNHLISSSNAKALEGNEESICTIAYTDAMFDPPKLGKSPFKRPDIGAPDESRCGNYLLN